MKDDLPLLLLTVQQAAAMCQVSTDRIYQWSYDPDFPVVMEAHQLRIHARKFDEWLAQRAERGRGQPPQANAA